jgi:hypothetical protein
MKAALPDLWTESQAGGQVQGVWWQRGQPLA